MKPYTEGLEQALEDFEREGWDSWDCDQNPYEPGTPAHKSWERGYEDCWDRLEADWAS